MIRCSQGYLHSFLSGRDITLQKDGLPLVALILFLKNFIFFATFPHSHLYIRCYGSRVGTFGTESAVRKRGGIRNLPYLNAKPRQIPLLGTYA